MHGLSVAQYLRNHIRTVPDWPAPGVQFRDITPLLQDAKVFRVLIDAFVHRYMDAQQRPDVVAGLDARGFILGSVDFDRMMGKYIDVVNLKVKDLMISNVISVSPEDHILKAASTMVRNRFRRIPVTDGEELVGMISLGDVHKALFQANISTGMKGR